MLRVYLLDNTPGVILPDDVSATKVEILRRLPGAEPNINSVKESRFDSSSNISEPSATHTRVDPYRDDSSSFSRDVIMDVQQTPSKEELKATTAQVSSHAGPLANTTSHRFLRSAHNHNRYAVTIGKKEEHAMCVGYNFNGDMYNLYMDNLCSHSSEYAFMSDPPENSIEIEKWKNADLEEIKSLVLEHDV
jgi:hypothetical protein